ncbi:MAG: hypothetical protein CVU64_18230 [Deltaproteobacteria bacterium HGW-Deltaproteobacteria-21]|jgi:predicted RNase H-like nuclease (RuvC/YqgF family)|nr:MAG: hypothetical protein CVU64_18230 [Deltaproteobacteria bacterium HGW-Deltaproteobacteria-21]PKN62838.1 MAG: hypothetical protein CVU57_21870 [Deltaproteobacteria bacterium HGW-Deltaproteobacteria-15]
MEEHDKPEGLGNCENHCRRIEVPTEEEVVALNAMRGIKQEVKLLKERLRTLPQTLPESLQERIELQEKLGRFKREWDGWEKKRKAAAKERMVLLGHEEPDSEDPAL